PPRDVEHHRRQPADYRRGVQLPRRGLAVVPADLLVPAGRVADGERAARLPAARLLRVPALRHVAVHPARARLQRPAGVLHQALHRLSEPRRPAWRRHRVTSTEAGLGEGWLTWSTLSTTSPPTS